MHHAEAFIGKTLLGNYVIETSIGHGAMGAIYQGRHRVLDRKVAVKVLRHNLRDDPDERHRFHVEAETVAKLTHPNVVTILDFGTTDEGAPCIVTEFIAGETITDILDSEGPIEPWRATNIIEQVLSALIEAHSMGIVHRDIKCDNIMVQRLRDGQEQVKLVDFGISLMKGHEVSDSGYIFGTPLYMCPEQCKGMTPDGRGDLYSLGVVFFEMLTGEPLFYFDSPYDYLNAHITIVPPRPSDMADQPIPRAIEAIILKLLEKNPNDRYQSAQEVKQALHQWSVSRVSTDKGIMPIREGSDSDRTQRFDDRTTSVRTATDIEREPYRAAILSEDHDLVEVLSSTLVKAGLEPSAFEDPTDLASSLRSDQTFDLYFLTTPREPQRLGPLATDILVRDPLAEILILGGMAHIQEFPDGLQWAASDFLIRPFGNARTLMGRIRAARRRRQENRVQSDLLRTAMAALAQADRQGNSLAGELQAMLERIAANPPHIVLLGTDATQRALQRRGHQVLLAENVEDMCRLIAKRGLDAVAIETNISKQSAVEATSAVISRRPDLEVILAGFQAELSDLLEAVDMGATDFSVRPIEDLETFCLKVELAVTRRRRRLRIRRLLKTLDTVVESTDEQTTRERFEHVRAALSETLTIEAEPPDYHETSPLQGLSNPVILVAEPDRIVASLIERSIETTGWTVVGAHSMSSAIAAIRQNEFDLAVVASKAPTDPAWTLGALLAGIAEGQKQTPVILIGQPSPGQITGKFPTERIAGRIATPLQGIASIKTAVQLGIRLRKRLLQIRSDTNMVPNDLTVLLVEPNTTIAERLSNHLHQHRIPVLHATDLEQACNLVARYDISVVAANMEILLAGTGDELERIHTIESQVPIVGYGPSPNRTQVLSSLASGARTVIADPVTNFPSFVEAIQSAHDERDS
ncbi:MAG: protein kinase [Deltaproteobacteria bacterium]|nr:protein kinase [Deltaproteobacteria bacterium]